MPIDTEDEATQAAQKRVGDVLGGKWRLDRLLGLGGMAAVYAAEHTNNGKTVAVKVLHPELVRQESIKTRFLREGYIANKVGHPGAVSVLDDGTDPDGSVYLVMELLEGESLAYRSYEANDKLPPKQIMRIAQGILDVLVAAHAQAIVHRDLKADNVFLTNDGTVKVLDFGVARMTDQTGDAKTRTGLVMGTPEYMPPEQARGRSELIDGRTDLWAVGAMMFKLFTGRYVHEAETPNEVLLLAMTEPAKKLAEVLPGVHPKVAEVVDRALAFERDERFPDAAAMRVAVDEASTALEESDVATTVAGDIAAQAVVHAMDETVPAPPPEHLEEAAAALRAERASGTKEAPVAEAAVAAAVPAVVVADAPPAVVAEAASQDGSFAAAETPGPLAVDARAESPTGGPVSKPNLWVHTQATPPSPPRAPRRKRSLVPLIGLLVLAGGGAAVAAFALPRVRGDADPLAASSEASGEGTTTLATDMTGADAGESDDAASEAGAEAVHPAPTAPHVTHAPVATAHHTITPPHKKVTKHKVTKKHR